MSENAPIPQKGVRTGVSMLVFKDGKVLLGKRKGSWASGEYGNPGGWLEPLEGFTQAAKRELQEECGIEIGDVHFSSIANITHYAPHQAILVNLTAHWLSGEVQTLEPEKCEGWGWYDLDALPEPLTDGTKKAIEGYQTGRTFFDAP